jgi:hypothetical protein
MSFCFQCRDFGDEIFWKETDIGKKRGVEEGGAPENNKRPEERFQMFLAILGGLTRASWP